MAASWNETVRWRELFKDAGDSYRFVSPITDAEIKDLETKLEVSLPDQFLSLYAATNGIYEQ